MIAGSPVSCSASCASTIERTVRLLGMSSPIPTMAARNSSRSSALSMASALAPISSQPNSASVPSCASARATLSPVCPPIVGSTASGRSLAMILRTKAGVIGSI